MYALKAGKPLEEETIIVNDDGPGNVDDDLLMEVMEARSALEEAEDVEEVQEIRSTNEGKMQQRLALLIF